MNRAGVALLVFASVLAQPSERQAARGQGADAAELRIPVAKSSLYARSIGRGQPAIVLHGGPDFDISYLLPELDQLGDIFRLIYYDQRGRGRSVENVQASDVTLATDLDDVDRVRQHFRLDTTALLGHSWGAVLALEYALRHPRRVSHLVLMNPAPASAADLAVFRKAYLARLGSEMDRQRALVATEAYKTGDPATVAARYRIHFKPALTRATDYERLMARMEAAFVKQGKEGILLARAVEDQLMRDTWEVPGYDLLPKLRSLSMPTIVIAGETDFIPVETASNIARAIPNARFVELKNCGHFAYLECPAEVRSALKTFLVPGRD